jgi:hypothetical protein
MKSIIKFDNLIKDIKILKSSNIAVDKTSFEKFTLLVAELSFIKANSIKLVDTSIQTNKIISLLKSLKSLKAKVYDDRLAETKEFINQNPEMFKISSFELMEHNFRENTHSNILKYLFDCSFTNTEGIEALYLLLSETEGKKIKNLKAKLLSRKYKIEREFHTGNGRIDLLIKDDFNKLIIVIENKVYASIAEKDFDEEKNVTSTQLDLYKDYFSTNEKYKNWDKIFILLSYKKIEDFNHTNFELINYDMLFKVLMEANFQDNIVKDYLILLHSLTKNIHDKSWLIEQSNYIKSERGNINLNTLETINNFTNGS